MPSANMSYPAPPPYSWHTVNSSQTVNSIPTHLGGCAVRTSPFRVVCEQNCGHPGNPGKEKKFQEKYILINLLLLTVLYTGSG